MTAVDDTAHNLVRASLVAHLAAQLGDPALTRRASLEAESAARLLAGMPLPPSDDGRDLDVGLTLDDLFVRAYPNARPVLDLGGPTTPRDDTEPTA